MENKEEIDFEIGDVENFSSNKDQQFSHSSLVMMAMKKSLEAGNREMKAGWFNSRTDNQGNVIKTYVDDTRKNFIESVRSCLMIMACDLDSEAEQYIDECLNNIEIRKNVLTKLEDESWNKLTPESRIKNVRTLGIYHVKGVLTHPSLKEELVWFEIDMYRSILAELSKLTKRLDFYKAQVFEA